MLTFGSGNYKPALPSKFARELPFGVPLAWLRRSHYPRPKGMLANIRPLSVHCDICHR
jgi:hypothetical protein